MSNLSVQKVNTLPGILQANTLYLKKSATSGLLEVYLTNNDASDIRHTLLDTELDSLVSSKLQNILNNNSARFSLATLPNPFLVGLGGVINIPKSEFTNNQGMPAFGIDVRSDLYNWVTSYEGQVFSMQEGTNAAPLIANWTPGSNAKTIMPLPGGNIVIPWQLMHVGLRLRVSAVYRFVTMASGSTFCMFGIGFGKANSTANPFANYIYPAYAANRPYEIVSDIHVTSPTGYTSRQIVKNHQSATVAEQFPIDNGSSLDWSSGQDHYIQMFVDSADTAAYYDLLAYKVELMS